MGGVTFHVSWAIRRVNAVVRENEVTLDADAGREDADESLARRAVARDPVAWAELFELHYRAIYGFVRYRLRGSDEAEDLASQVFEIAYSRADRFDYQGIPIQGWLLGIARNVLRDHLKKLARRGPSDELDELAMPSVPDESGSVDLHHDLTRAMRSLTADQQEVIAMRFLNDRSVAETAVLMGRSEDAVKNLQRRALAALRRALLDSGYEEDQR